MAIPGNFLSSTTESIDPNISGWAAKLNCSIGLGSGGRNRDGLLKLTSSSAGEMQARTVSSYTVAPGETYWTFADASGTVAPERIGIRWLASSGAEISITWSLTTATASPTLHRISVAGIAPAGAAQAQVLVSSSPAAGGVISLFENVYLGFPIRFPRNLLSFNAESGGEIDISAWGAEANCAMSRTAPMVQWPVDWYYSGGEVLGLTVTAAGNASALCVDRVPVSPGSDYMAYCYLMPPTTAAVPWVELRYYSGGGAQISAHRSTLAAATTGFQRQYASAVAPLTAATASIAVGISAGTAGQVVRWEGAVVAPAPVTRTGSVVSFADASFEAGVGSWAVTAGVATLARSTPWGAQAFSGNYSLTISSPTATASTIQSTKYPVSEVVNWRLEADVKVTAGGWSVDHTVRWFSATDVLISESSTAPATIPTDGNWWTISDDFSAPAGAVTAQIQYDVTATSASSTLQLDFVGLRQTLPAAEATADDATGSVRLVLRELEVGDLITVWRVLPGGVRQLVRGADGLLDQAVIGSDEMLIEDYEAPLGVTVEYLVETANADGLTGLQRRDSNTVAVGAGDPNYVWLKDPVRPQLNLRALVKQAPEWTNPIPRAEYKVRGRKNLVVHTDMRSGGSGDLVVWTQSDEEREALKFLLSSGSVLLWQSAPGMGEPDVYVAVGDAARPRIVAYAPEPWREWTLPLTEVDPPSSGVAGSAAWTVHDVAVENATGYDVLTRYATVFDLLINNRSA